MNANTIDALADATIKAVRGAIAPIRSTVERVVFRVAALEKHAIEGKATGERGPPGPEGPTGPMPDHEWHADGVRLRFEQEDANGRITWGEWSESLRGPPGRNGLNATGGGAGGAVTTTGNNYFPGGWT